MSKCDLKSLVRRLLHAEGMTEQFEKQQLRVHVFGVWLLFRFMDYAQINEFCFVYSVFHNTKKKTFYNNKYFETWNGNFDE